MDAETRRRTINALAAVLADMVDETAVDAMRQITEIEKALLAYGIDHPAAPGVCELIDQASRYAAWADAFADELRRRGYTLDDLEKMRDAPTCAPPATIVGGPIEHHNV